MKTPKEIKKGLIEPETFCDHCSYNGEPNGCNHPNGLCQAWENADDAYELIQQLEDHIREVTKLVPKWISVEERLPEMDTRVAVLYRFPRSETLFSSVLDYYAADPEPHFQHTLGEGGPIVCYWMPLPSAPEVWP